MAEEKLRASIDFAHIFMDHLTIQESEDLHFPFILHGGESLSITNDNLMDLILLKSPRIGHGLNLSKHSYMMDTIKKHQICIEANPLSNQILGYTTDLRLHPLITYLNYGLKVSISSDDDGLFGTNLASWDFFACAFSMEFSIFDFKKVCNDSIESSCINEEDKKRLKIEWEMRWNEYLDKIIDYA